MKSTIVTAGFLVAGEAALSVINKHNAGEKKATKWNVVQDNMASLKEIAKNLSVEDAMQAVGTANIPDDIKAFLQGEAGEDSFGPDYNPAAVVQKINEVFEKAQEELDTTYTSCTDDLADLQVTLDAMATDKGHAGAMLEDAIAEKNLWSAEQESSQAIVDRLREELDEFNNQCALAEEQSKQLIALISSDLKVVKGVIDGNKCKPADPFKPSTVTVGKGPGAAQRNKVTQPTSLLQVGHAKTKDELKAKARALLDQYKEMNRNAAHGGDARLPRYRLTKKQQSLIDSSKGMSLLRCSFPDGVSFLSFEDTQTAKMMVQMSNKKFRELQNHLEALLQQTVETAATTPMPAATTPLPSYNAVNLGGTPSSQNKEARDLAKEIRNRQLAGEDVDAEATCSFAGSPLCPQFFETLSDLGGDIDAELTEEEKYRADNARVCDETKKRMEIDIAGWDTHIENCSKHGAALASRITELKETIRSIETNYKEVLDHYEEQRTYCETTIKEQKSAMCGAIRVKTELMRMDSVPNEIWDCEVSPFEASACSATCEGGVKTWTREVLIKPSPKYGTKCPSLELTTQCSMFACPVKCKVGVWGEWSHCSAECGIGTHYRVRDIEVHPMHGGEACPALQESADCNAGICDEDCELTDWTEYSECTAYCGGGKQYREKHVKKEAVGGGVCPGKRNPQRYEIIECNTQSCAPGVPICNTKMDIILVVDSSGSIGFWNWPKVVQGISAIAHQVNYAHVQLGTVIFSSGVETYSVLTNDVDEIKRLYPGEMQKSWMGSVTNTAMAVAHAMNLLVEGGRAAEGAKQTIMIFSDGYPCCTHGARQMTEYAINDAIGAGIRVIMVPLGNADTSFIGYLNSLSSTDSTIPISTFDEFVEEETIAKLIEKTCDDIVMKPVGYKANVVIKDDASGTVTATHSSNAAPMTGTPAP
uniref:VWFA domain-containing protein n=1 Tax=Chromera velia CCMP2878 TaxID=1169474 RepID=A0A0G4FKC9_9ALVE|eukprot:Cvel_3449.t1-p1 / transcript=Cvel_3449.t1 / gene=Cvel_3449 / organism=Chromera_velia_CCMP2878 / gene_product=Spondin-1, putative / transcript_product=Spondin-1, putative / location=Cvel_scaffold139:14628-20015(-) / protein_length=931 / sequence_SO=supercontig / SO=protein_coding / is_pseudo=false